MEKVIIATPPTFVSYLYPLTRSTEKLLFIDKNPSRRLTDWIKHNVEGAKPAVAISNYEPRATSLDDWEKRIKKQLEAGEYQQAEENARIHGVALEAKPDSLPHPPPFFTRPGTKTNRSCD
jgi:hypothetical protein